MRTRTTVLPQYVLLALTWGASFLFIKIGLEGISPTQVVLGRLVLGAAALAVVCVLSRTRLPRQPEVWAHLAVVALLLCVVPYLLFAWAEVRISSGMASVYNATTPLMTALVALLALREDRLTRTRAVGLLLGFAGVVVLLAPWDSGPGAAMVTGQLACLAATGSYGVAYVYLRRFVTPYGLAALPVATVQVGLAAVLMVAAAPFVARTPVVLSARVVLAMVALGVFGTGLAYVWNTDVITHWGATNASTVTYLTPVVGIALGVTVLGESVGWNQPAGAAVVVLGIATAQQRFDGPWARLRSRGPGSRSRVTGQGGARQAAPSPAPPSS
ncbi:MAG: DMT family transporter [Cellulomonas sp.]|nr:DMT family transporter [Cellulomonas sp.]